MMDVLEAFLVVRCGLFRTSPHSRRRRRRQS